MVSTITKHAFNVLQSGSLKEGLLTPERQHTIVELIAESSLLDGMVLMDLMAEFCSINDLKVLNINYKQFTPIGFSFVVVLEQGHFAGHSWPEDGYLHLDLFTHSKEELNKENIETSLKTLLNPDQMRIFDLDYHPQTDSVDSWIPARVIINTPVVDFDPPLMHHSVVELSVQTDCDLEDAICNFCDRMDLHVVNQLHLNNSSVFVLEESHLVGHYCQELGYIHLDMVTCTQEPTNLMQVSVLCSELFQPKSISVFGVEY
ncbi:MAG: S-adenosylmethionine decarboxylase [Patescibacteria group bacterium]